MWLLDVFMDSVFVKPIFHVHGRFVRNDYGVYIYADGQAEKFDSMDIDFVNYGDLLKLLEGIGYKKIKKMQWYDVAEDDLEAGLHKLEGDADINAMCEHLMRNFGLIDEFHIYIEHEVDIPVPASDGGAKCGTGSYVDIIFE
ncbi:hypothetical protein PIB30_030641 [Stylosanthes scabra]|uniref:PB1-like domain-containing protein n=1 Tax=Stylosanthes scabra TaxID=79078 RepID=A0ABU6YAF9_9FABA|nr:hypothetical protein [Stylosanthes scabra]